MVCLVTANSALNVTASYVAQGASQAGILNPITAGVVYGQGGSFTTGNENNGGVSANSLDLLGGVAVEGNGNLYVADAGNNRIQVFDGEGTFKSEIANLGTPQAICVSGGSTQYLCDIGGRKAA